MVKKLLKGIVWILVLCALCYGGYVAYTRWWNTPSFTENAKNEVMNFIDKTGENIKSAITGLVKKETGNVISSVGEEIRTYGETIGGEASSSKILYLNVKDITKGGNIILNPTSSPFFTPPPPVSIALKVGVPILIAINPNSRYSVDWGMEKTTRAWETRRTRFLQVTHGKKRGIT